MTNRSLCGKKGGEGDVVGGAVFGICLQGCSEVFGEAADEGQAEEFVVVEACVGEEAAALVTAV